MDGLRGFVAQGMDGRKRARTPVSRSYPPGSYTFTATTSGWYRFVLWGGGASAQNTDGSGGGGAFILAERALAQGQRVSIVVGAQTSLPPNTSTGIDGNASSVTFPTGEVITAGGGQTTASRAGGVPTAGQLDTAYAGGAGVTSGAGNAGAGPGGGAGGAAGGFGGGGGAGGAADVPGGSGAAGASFTSGQSPGGGGGTNSTLGTPGAGGLVLINQLRLRG